MDNDELIKRITDNDRFSGVAASDITNAINDAQLLIRSYPLNDNVIGYATYLYACHLIYINVLKHKDRFQTVKADDGQYTKFANANADDWWDAFQHLLAEQGIGRNQVQFI
ncbi:MAG TPA: hypothetical protein DDW71_00460 [Lactobacillus sp.]|nr:hypothetical protein [Lactobacillus sp.]